MLQTTIFWIAAFVVGNHALVRLPMERHIVEPQGRGLIPVTVNNIGIRYTVPVRFGNDVTKYNLVVDTGSTNLWVGSPDCELCGFQNTHRCERPSRHSTVISYLAGFGSGHFCREDLEISGMKIKDQEFLTIDEGKAFASSKVGDGIIGFGPQSGSFGYLTDVDGEMKMHMPNSVMDNLFEQKLIEEPSFSLYMSRNGYNQLIIGGVDEKFFIGEMAYGSPVQEESWEVELDGVGIGDSIVCGPRQCSGLPDTGSPDAVAVPYKFSKVLDRQMTKAGAYKTKIRRQSLADDSSFLFYSYLLTPYTRIDLLPSFYITVGGFTFFLEGKDYTDKDAIHLSVNSAVPHFIMGDFFLHKVYTSYDLASRRVGFAYANH